MISAAFMSLLSLRTGVVIWGLYLCLYFIHVGICLKPGLLGAVDFQEPQSHPRGRFQHLGCSIYIPLP